MSVREIARLAKVSPSTVSLALRDSPKIPDTTKRKVRELAKRLGYRPNARVNELMSCVRTSRAPQNQACFGVVSFYDTPKPWESSHHLARIYRGMLARAEVLGYRLEPLWLRAPGMTYRRCRSILDARGIEGLLCFGSPDIDDEFPPEFDHYAIVTQGLSIKTPLHRVVSHVYKDMWRALEQVYQLGYRRPGLVIGRYEDIRSAHGYLSAYLGWWQVTLGTTPLPVLQLDKVELKPVREWLAYNAPDVMIFVHHYNVLPEFTACMRESGLHIPEDIGVAVISQILDRTDYSGLEENQQLIGAWAVELLVSRIMNRDLGIPTNPRIEMVERHWVDGKTLRKISR
ncbi:LacI family DNA-binding transcriptional regulator [Opitutus sp. ER46]|uniref:LacI family DNA-binding transcriptional regulator n=1 Tax=Opitutus sp. ER46 TaxID=2161864 RepID=UPI000D3080A9|nr:LacI family DNA-binding transcriptional regulator [Opitutus sp. ER46]PTY00378.1 LacI family transcriptional regulator [Opitutus sp. ER46]